MPNCCSDSMENLHGASTQEGLAHWVVLQPLAHLLAVVREHKAVAHQVLERRLIKERRGQHHERVEPAPRLILAYVTL